MEEAVFTRESITNEDQPDAQEEEAAIFTLESIIKKDPPNAHQAQHRPRPRFDECVISVHS